IQDLIRAEDLMWGAQHNALRQAREGHQEHESARLAAATQRWVHQPQRPAAATQRWVHQPQRPAAARERAIAERSRAALRQAQQTPQQASAAEDAQMAAIQRQIQLQFFLERERARVAARQQRQQLIADQVAAERARRANEQRLVFERERARLEAAAAAQEALLEPQRAALAETRRLVQQPGRQQQRWMQQVQQAAAERARAVAEAPEAPDEAAILVNRVAEARRQVQAAIDRAERAHALVEQRILLERERAAAATGYQPRPAAPAAAAESAGDKAARLKAEREANDRPDSLALRYSRGCGVCLAVNPRRRAVLVACGHMTCAPCAEHMADNRGGEFDCPFCRKRTTYVKTFEDLEDETSRSRQQGAPETRKRKAPREDDDQPTCSKRARRTL
ncbi:hypothetical protein PENTCL1PPCAC_24034, partial [Pristionchus entomophagus]